MTPEGLVPVPQPVREGCWAPYSSSLSHRQRVEGRKDPWQEGKQSSSFIKEGSTGNFLRERELCPYEPEWVWGSGGHCGNLLDLEFSVVGGQEVQVKKTALA